MNEDDPTATRIYLEGGQYVRASETIGQVSVLIDNAGEYSAGFVPITDPGDERHKLVKAARVLWIEQECEVSPPCQ